MLSIDFSRILRIKVNKCQQRSTGFTHLYSLGIFVRSCLAFVLGVGRLLKHSAGLCLRSSEEDGDGTLMLLSCSFPPVRVGEEDVGWHWCWIYRGPSSRSESLNRWCGGPFFTFVVSKEFLIFSCVMLVGHNPQQQVEKNIRVVEAEDQVLLKQGGRRGLGGAGGGRRWKEVGGVREMATIALSFSCLVTRPEEVHSCRGGWWPRDDAQGAQIGFSCGLCNLAQRKPAVAMKGLLGLIREVFRRNPCYTNATDVCDRQAALQWTFSDPAFLSFFTTPLSSSGNFLRHRRPTSHTSRRFPQLLWKVVFSYGMSLGDAFIPMRARWIHDPSRMWSSTLIAIKTVWHWHGSRTTFQNVSRWFVLPSFLFIGCIGIGFIWFPNMLKAAIWQYTVGSNSKVAQRHDLTCSEVIWCFAFVMLTEQEMTGFRFVRTTPKMLTWTSKHSHRRSC